MCVHNIIHFILHSNMAPKATPLESQERRAEAKKSLWTRDLQAYYGREKPLSDKTHGEKRDSVIIEVKK